MELVSIIVPIYKVEKYLDVCVQSIRCQTYPCLEIILVDDGSPDSCPQLCDRYAREDSRITVIHKKNGGLGDARNAGAKRAQGKYLLFVDSDDYVSEDYFQTMDEAGAREDSDLIVFAKDIAGQGIDERDLYKKMCAAESLQEKRKILLSSRIIFQPPYKRFRREIIEKEHLRFIKGMYVGEDFNFCFAYMLECRSIRIEYRKIYFIDVSENDSLSRKYRSDIDTQLQWEIKEAAKTLKNSRLNTDEKKELLTVLDYFMARNIFTCIAENFKTGKPSYRKNKEKYVEICSRFNTPLYKPDVYYSKIHFLLRILLYRRCIFPLYLITRTVKGREFQKYWKKE